MSVSRRFLDLASVSRRFHVGFTSVLRRFRVGFTSASGRFHVDFTSVSRRFRVGPGAVFGPLGTTFYYSLKYKNDPKKINSQKIWSDKNYKNRKYWKKRTRRSCEAEASRKQKKNQNSEDPSGSIQDITRHLIHDKNTSIAVPCAVFNVPSAGYNPRWIYWSYDVFFDPGDFGPRGRHRPDPEVKIRRSKGLTP